MPACTHRHLSSHMNTHSCMQNMCTHISTTTHACTPVHATLEHACHCNHVCTQMQHACTHSIHVRVHPRTCTSNMHACEAHPCMPMHTHSTCTLTGVSSHIRRAHACTVRQAQACTTLCQEQMRRRKVDTSFFSL